MIRRTKAWLTVAVLFGLGNVAGAVMAAVAREPLHAATHVVLAFLSAYAVRALVGAPAPAAALPDVAPIGALAGRFTQLEISLEGLAVGVERMGEGQRTITRLFAERNGDAEHIFTDK